MPAEYLASPTVSETNRMNFSWLKRRMNSGTGSDAVVQTFVANAAIQGINILCGVISARALGPEGRGELAAIIMWPQLLAYALTLGIPVASVYHIRKSPERASRLAATALFSSLVMGVVAALAGWFVIPISLHTYPPAIIHFAQLAVLLAPVSLVALTLSVQAQSAGSFRHFNIFRSAQSLFVLIALLCGLVFHMLHPKTAALAYLLAGLPVTVWNLIWVWRHFQLKSVVDFAELKTLLSYGVRAWGADLIGTAASQVDRFLVVGLLAPKLMGLYVVAQSAANLLNVLPSAMVPVLMPKAVSRSFIEIVNLTGRAARVTLFVLIVAGLPFMFLGGWLLHFLYGERFDGAESVFRLLVMESIIDGVTYVLSQAFLSAGSPGTLAFLEATSFLVAVPCLAVLVPRFGLVGAGCSVLLVASVRLTFVLANFPFRFHLRPPSLFVRREDLAFLTRQG